MLGVAPRRWRVGRRSQCCGGAPRRRLKEKTLSNPVDDPCLGAGNAVPGDEGAGRSREQSTGEVGSDAWQGRLRRRLQVKTPSNAMDDPFFDPA